MSKNNLFNEVLKDNISGSVALLNQIKEKLRNYLNSSASPDPKVVTKDLKQAAEELKDFAVIIHFSYHFLKHAQTNPSVSSLLKFLDQYEKQWSLDSLIQNFNQEISLKNKTVLLHSNSSTIQKVLTHYEGNKSGLRIIQTYSSPSGEGLTQGGKLSAKGFDVNLIHENNAWNWSETIDFFLFGADRMETRRFMNKAGTAQLCLLARHIEQPVYVVADPRKMVKKDFYDFLEIKMSDKLPENESPELKSTAMPVIEVKNQNFEWIPLELVTKVYF